MSFVSSQRNCAKIFLREHHKCRVLRIAAILEKLENGHGQQTNGVNTDNCNIGKLNSGCPPEPQWWGSGTHYANIPGEPFWQIPTYFNVVHCNGDSAGGDESWRIVYYVYFKKDTGHMSDWEGVVLRFIRGGGGWIRESAILEQGKKNPLLYCMSKLLTIR